ncbi:MAG: dockerin type I repeat-containing protein, partial [Ruminococcus sp.]|nr:dockerin type I repeat-containing protein [Ruminococcus sp.]
KNSPEIKLVNRTIDHQYINWYMCNESDYNGADTKWTPLGDYQNVSQWQFDDRPEEGGNYLIRCVVTNSDLTTYEDIVRLVYEPLKSDTIVSSVEVNDVTIPACGEKADFTLAPADDSFYINAVYWTDVTDSKNRVYLKENDTFEAGHKYELEVWIRANEYYKFQTDSDGWLEISAVVGGKEAEVILPGSSISAELLVTFTVEDNVIPTQSSSSENTTPSNLTTPSSPSYPTSPSNPSGSDNPNPKGILGDADCNGKVNVKDATAIQKHTASLITLSETGLILADVDANTNVNVKDATAIQKWIAGIPTSFPIGEAV